VFWFIAILIYVGNKRVESQPYLVRFFVVTTPLNDDLNTRRAIIYNTHSINCSI